MLCKQMQSNVALVILERLDTAGKVDLYHLLEQGVADDVTEKLPSETKLQIFY